MGKGRFKHGLKYVINYVIKYGSRFVYKHAYFNSGGNWRNDYVDWTYDHRC